MSNQRKKVGVGWLKTSQDGKKQFVSMVINGGLSPDINLVMFKNSFKEEDNQPDYIIYMNPPKETASSEASQSSKQAGASEFPEPVLGTSDDDVPF